MKNQERATQVTTETVPGQGDQAGCISIAEDRRKAFEASDKARQAQVAYAEEEAKRWYDYRVEELSTTFRSHRHLSVKATSSLAYLS